MTDKDHYGYERHYCKGSKIQQIKIRKDLEENKWYVTLYPFEIFYFVIYYCPYCGEKLDKDIIWEEVQS
jgi:hypothetical protein